MEMKRNKERKSQRDELKNFTLLIKINWNCNAKSQENKRNRQELEEEFKIDGRAERVNATGEERIGMEV